MVENLFTEHFKYVKVILTNIHVLDGGGADVVDE
jgi:hypothetical protein